MYGNNKKNLIFSERSGKQQKFDKRLIDHVVKLVEQGVPRRTIFRNGISYPYIAIQVVHY